MNPIFASHRYKLVSIIRTGKKQTPGRLVFVGKRVGCVGCPMNSRNAEELEALPKYKANWIRWFGHLIDDAKRDGRPCRFKTAQEYYDWWIGGKALPKDDGQMRFEEVEKDGIQTGDADI